MKHCRLLHIARTAQLLLATLLLTAATQTAWAETVNYLDASGTLQSHEATPVTFSDTDEEFLLGDDGTETWYVVNSDVDLTKCLDILGDVHLILADHTTLSVNPDDWSVYVFDNSSLTIYSQSLGSDMGKLVIDSNADFYVGQNSQAIINGGEISVTTENNAVHIASDGSMTINNGTVSLTGTNFGVFNDEGSLTINGGTVTITGGAAISSEDNYTENGGTVTLNDTSEGGGDNPGEGGGEETPDPVNVNYLDASGTSQSVDAIPVTGFQLGTDGEETWYVVNSDVDLTNCLDIFGDVHLILADHTTLSINYDDWSVYVYENSSLTIYSQSLGSDMGKLVINTGWGFCAFGNSLIINGGNISVTPDLNAVEIANGANMTINNGTVSLTGTNFGVVNDEGSLTINGGTVTITGGTAISSMENYTENGGTVTLNDTGEGGGEETPDPVNVSYLDASGTSKSVDAIPVTDFQLGTDGEETWYVVNSDVDFTEGLYISGDVHLILADHTTLSVNPEDWGVYVHANSSLTIYSQSLGSDMGKLVINTGWGICAYGNSLIINGGRISVSTDREAVAIENGSSITINNGTVSLKGTDFGVLNNNGSLTINGGTVTIFSATPISDMNAYTENGGTVTLTTVKITPAVTAPTAIADLAYNGSAQPLVAAGTTDNGIMTYSLTGGDDYTTFIPTATDAGTYTVYYKVPGDDIYNEVAGSVEVTIGYHAAELADKADNADVLADIIANYGGRADVTLAGRTLYKDGKWNTLCLPFDVDLTDPDGPLYGATARTVTAASISGTTLNLTFSEPVNTLQPGTPYIIKWDGDGTSNIENPVFQGVTISTDKHDYDNAAEDDLRVRFCGTDKSTAFDSEDKSILLMGGGNTLYRPAAGAGIGAQRAYFKIGDDGTLLVRRITAFNIDFGDGETTGIQYVQSSMSSDQSDAWYSLDGRKVDTKKPTQQGIYINNGKKVVIK